jgi:signal recognition particle subunit SRP54
VFESLQGSFDRTLKKLKGEAKIKPSHIEEALVDLKTSLLEADVQYSVVERFVQQVQSAALGAEVSQGLNPYQQFLRILTKQMLAIFGEAKDFSLSFKPPVVILMAGLQGSGKTTSSGKLALLLKKKFKRKPLLVSVDVTRPAAIEQLERLAKDIKVDYFGSSSQVPVERAAAALKFAQTYGLDVVIVDTAGRLSVDEALMAELAQLKETLQPHHILYVADAMSGQQGLQVATDFSSRVGLTGAVLSKADGDARGGVAFSIREAIQVPLQFVGTGEKMENFEAFHADRWVGRILGMGDISSLLEKAQDVVADEGIDQKKQATKILKGQMSLLDFQQMMKMMKKMGSVGSLMGMIPGMSSMAQKVDPEQIETKLKRVDAAINSMTAQERLHPDVINGERKRRISKGSGVSVEEINQFLREFSEMQKMMKKMSGMKGLMKGMAGGKGMRMPF